ncbi:MAG: serpin family protein [Clostridia bacterium]|nr:serpin family protein [Clostridia bacterium]
MKKIISFVLALTMLTLALCSCGTKQEPDDFSPDGDLMVDYVAQAVKGRMSDEKFIDAMLHFSAELFKLTTSEKKQSSLISPLSVIVALAMTANGAESDTRAQFEQVFGLTTDEANEYLFTYVSSLFNDEKTKMQLANSIWFDSDAQNIDVNPDFLQTNKNYYDAQAYKYDFSDPKTVEKINEWVKDHTDEMIEKIVDELDPNCVMVLINALVFDSVWETKYDDKDCTKDVFNAYDGTKNNAKFMKSVERYISGEGFSGFMKNYAGGYKFIALLPDEGTDVFEFIENASYKYIFSTITDEMYSETNAIMPAFEYDYDIEMNKALISMGLSDAFSDSKADFSGIDKRNDLYIDKVLHKTHIEVKQEGTKAAAVTSVSINTKGAFFPMTTVKLDRPFVYMIIDSATNLPVFMGVVTEVK